ncbi:MAG: regulatory protein RecX [Flavipsychrobacter sp.]|nr:regulatory protein RecX [Flavipsychrobacter sp.]
MEHIRKAILHYCKYQERCHSEVRNKLYELGCTTPDVEQHLTELIEINALNEERFAKAYAGGKFRMKQWGKEKIKQQLKLKKISDYCIKKALNEIDGKDYENTLKKLATKKAQEIKGDRSILSRKSKLYRYLVQKGYERDLAMDQVKELI